MTVYKTYNSDNAYYVNKKLVANPERKIPAILENKIYEFNNLAYN